MQASGVEQHEVSIFQIFAAFWRHRRLTALWVAIALVLGLIYLHVAHYKYTVTLTVAPVSSPHSASSGALATVSMIAPGLAGGDNSNAGLYAEDLQSTYAAELIAQDDALMKQLFADELDPATSQWRTHSPGILSGLRHLILGDPEAKWQSPNAARVYDLLYSRLNVRYSRLEPTIMLTYSDTSAQRAADFLLATHRAADKVMRQRMLERANAYIDYLHQQLDIVSQIPYRTALVQVLAEQEEKKMMASADVAYAADIFSGPTIPNRPSSPNPLVVLILSVIGGAVVSWGIVFGRSLLHYADSTPQRRRG